MPLVSVREFRDVYPNLIAEGQDPVIESAVVRADQLMASWCGLPANDAFDRSLVSGTYTLKPEPSALQPRALDVGLRTVTGVTSVHVDEAWDYGAGSLLDSADYLYDNQRGLLWLKPGASGAWSSSPLANRVVLTSGFVTAPEAIKAVAIVQARYLLELPKVEGRENSTTGYGSMTPAEAEQLLAPGVAHALIPYIYWPSRAG